MPGIFLGLKFQACAFFLGLQYEAPSEPPVMYTSSTPPGVTLSNDLCNLSRNNEKLCIVVLCDKLHDGCYIRQCFLELVWQQRSIVCWQCCETSCRSGVTLGNVS